MTANPHDAPKHHLDIAIYFTEGYPTIVENLATKKHYKDPLSIVEFLNEVGGEHGIGRIDIVENRFIGLKVTDTVNFIILNKKGNPTID